MSDAAAASTETADKGNVRQKAPREQENFASSTVSGKGLCILYIWGAAARPQPVCQHRELVIEENWRTGPATRWTYKALVGYLQEPGWELVFFFFKKSLLSPALNRRETLVLSCEHSVQAVLLSVHSTRSPDTQMH